MTTSPLVGRKLTTNKHSDRQGNVPERFIIHHTAGGGNQLAIYMLSGTLNPGDKKVSAHYILLTTAELVGSVDEERRAWTTGWAADKSAITVETVNTKGAPNWDVSAAQMEKLAELAADLSIRYNWGPLTRDNVKGHREYAATACPGPTIWGNFDNIINRANQIRTARLGGATAEVPDATVIGTLDDLSKLIDRIVRGELGNGQDRVHALMAMGMDRDAINAISIEVARRVAELRASTPGTLEEPKVDDGMSFAELDALINKIIRGDYGAGAERVSHLKSLGLDDSQISAIATEVTARVQAMQTTVTTRVLIEIHRLITQIIRGDWGNGQERVDKLKAAGYTQDQITAIQTAVSERLQG